VSTAAIEMRQIGKRFGELEAVRAFNLSVEDGQFVALLGPSGCGKTTTLRMIAGLLQPTSGEIFVKGRLLNDVPVHRRNVGMVFQNHALFPHKNAFNNIAFGLKYRKVAKVDIARRVRRALEIVRLQHCEKRFPAELSGGQQQRIAVARAIVIEPDILLFDEPLSSLDAGLREEMRIELKRIQRTLGITTVFVTHDQAEALAMADKVVVMRDGQKEQEGAPEDVYSRPASEFVARFFGHVNEIVGGTVGLEGDLLQVRIGDGAIVKVAGAQPAGGPIRLLLRAERIRVGREFAADPFWSILPATVAGSDYLGMLVRYTVEATGLRLNVVQPLEGPALRDGATVQLRIRADDWMVL
jgi:putative spermidine/putrescine transport system ATP-binding protein/spermidine/putrescine transport system ATP-binding protein